MKGLLHKGMIVNLFDYWVYGQFDVPINHDHRLSRCQSHAKQDVQHYPLNQLEGSANRMGTV